MLLSPRLVLAQRLLQSLKKRSRRGFTLIELLVVVVIIGILASIALPSFVGAQDKARNSAVQGNLNTIRMGLEQYATDHNGSYPSTGAENSATGLQSNNYVPGNKFPKSPWATTSQAASLPASGVLSSTAANVAAGSAMAGLQATINATGNVATMPAAAADYGAIEYDLDNASQTYIIYGTGKKGKGAVVAAQSSNGGQ